jgi:H2-forming N5,N10-methylenetetrahydromethanopterin dehydrogenase-like enzyme
MLKILKKITKIKIPRYVRPTVIVILIILFLYLCRSLFFAAWVNGRPVSRLSLIKQLEKQGGKTVLDNLIEQALINDEARKNKIKIKTESVDAELKRIEDLVKAQGISLEEALSFRSQTKADLIEQIKTQKIIEEILGRKISVSEEEIRAFFEKNKTLYEKGSNLETLKEQIKTQIFQQKLSEEYQKWIEELKVKAKIFYFLKF